MRPAHATRSRTAASVAAAVTLSLASLFAGIPVSAADPYDDDGASSSDAGDAGGGGVSEPSGDGMQEPTDAGGSVPEAPDSGGGGTPEPELPEQSGGEVSEPAGSGTEAPTELDAPAQDVETAESSTTTQISSSSSSQEVSSYQETLTSTVSTSTLSTAMTLSSPVSQWNSSWLSYDSYYRPIFTNPYRSPLQVIYDYGGGPRVFTVPPLRRATIDVPNAGVYSFTAVTKPASGPPTNVSVGSFSGGGFQPAPGQDPPAKPAQLNITRNALVQVKFDRGTSEPFRVSSLTDLGKDPAAKTTTKVLLDEEIPAWGEWSKTPQGDAVFVISVTQLLPGVSRPGQDPLPGYNIKLAAAQQSTSWFNKNKTLVIVVAVGVLALAAALGLVLTSRRRAAADNRR